MMMLLCRRAPWILRPRGGIEPLHVPMSLDLKSSPDPSRNHGGPLAQIKGARALPQRCQEPRTPRPPGPKNNNSSNQQQEQSAAATAAARRRGQGRRRKKWRRDQEMCVDGYTCMCCRCRFTSAASVSCLSPALLHCSALFCFLDGSFLYEFFFVAVTRPLRSPRSSKLARLSNSRLLMGSTGNCSSKM